MKKRSMTVAIATMLLLVGCASPSTYDTAAADDLQARVLAVTQAVGAADYATADARLAELSVAADAALAKGWVSAERHTSILAAAALVQIDVDAAISAAEVAAAAEVEKQRLAGDEAARQAAEDYDEGDDDGDNSGKGKKGD